MRQETNYYDESGADDTLSNAQERLADFASKIKEKASQFGSTVSQTVDRKRESAAHGLDRAASTLHEGVGSAAQKAHTVVQQMESTADYLRSHQLSDMGNDLKNVCRRYPVQAMISAAILGFLIGRKIRR